MYGNDAQIANAAGVARSAAVFAMEGCWPAHWRCLPPVSAVALSNCRLRRGLVMERRCAAADYR